MNINHKLKVTANLLKQRNFSYVVCTFLMIICSILSLKVFSLNDRIIVIPNMNEVDKQYVLDGKHIPDEYLRDWGYKLLGDLFTANPKTVNLKNKRFLEWALSSSSLESDLSKTAKALRKDNISTAFYPEDHEIHHSKREIHIQGRFLTHFGRSKKPVMSHKTFVLGWQVMPNGLIGIRDLKEILSDKKGT